jgi:hypothetical protein
MLTGYRTILFNLAMAVVALTGHTVSPDLLNTYLDGLIAAWVLGAILLRAITTTPVGRASHPLTEAVTALDSKLETLLGHPLADAATAQMLVETLTKLTSTSQPAPASGEAQPQPVAAP